MMELLLPYLAGPVALVLCLMVSASAYLHAKRKEHAARVLEARLPDACHYEDLRERIAATETSLAELSEQLAEAKLTIGRRDEAESWLRENAQRYEELQRLLPNVTAQVEAVQNELTDLRGQRDTLLKDQAEAEARRTWLKEETARATEAYEKVNSEIQKARTLVNDLAGREAALKVSVAEAQERLQQRLQQLQQIEADVSKTQLVLQELRRQLDQGQTEQARLEKELHDLDVVCNETRAELKRLQQAVETACRKAEQSAKEAALAEQKAQALDLRAKEAARALGESESKVAQLQAKLDSMRKEEAEAKKQRDAAKAESDRLAAEVKQAGQLLDSYKTYMDKATAQIGRIAEAGGAKEELRLAELWSPLLTPHVGQPTEADEEEAVEHVAQYMEDHRLRFPRRTINAFHTAMKVQDMSPLCVLAGISGTGKSELPRRYAEAIGMHFLNVPVQPRWDSPQDMFGFFNYMEGRYRATELARALVQMDPYGGKSRSRGWDCDESWLDNHCRAEEMLVVLLDEMNLARVEYYFSELLSKLETRRGIDVELPAQREKAEVVLDVGLRVATQTQRNQPPVIAQPTLRLFVGTNVLFVGTMNEDESTQTLSDKVMDRANVLRFGKPANLKIEGNGDTPATPKQYIEYDHWQSWLQSTGELDGKDEQLDVWIGRLNDALNRIHRPFAFRTDKAIRAYVANYPGAMADDQMLKWAVADQIEMKVFPKLRGLDLADRDVQSAVQAMGGVLHDLGDSVLEAAFREATGRDRHQFVWQGIDRQDEQ